MAKTRYAPDRGLTARMTLTMFLLGLVFVAFITVLVLILGATNRVSGGGIVFIAVLFGLALGVGSLFYSDKIALSTARAVVVSPQDGPDAARVHGIVDRLTALANMPKPRVAIAPSPMLNAFATGRNSKTAVLVVTTGLLRSNLDDRELEGVLAHELSHVAHKDVVVMTIASFIGIIAALLVRFAFYSELFGGGGRGRGGNNNNGGAAPGRADRDGGRHRGLRDQLPAHPAAVPVPGAGRRPGRGAAHRAAVGAGQRAAEGQRVDERDPDQGPAHRRAAERLLLRPGVQGGRQGRSTCPACSPRTRRWSAGCASCRRSPTS